MSITSLPISKPFCVNIKKRKKKKLFTITIRIISMVLMMNNFDK